MNKPYEPWRKKEPGKKLSVKATKSLALSERERAQMEKRSNAKVFIALSPFSMILQPKVHSYFIVYIAKPLHKKEIIERMEKAFGDIDWA